MSKVYVAPGQSALVVDDNGLIALDTREMLLELGFDQVDVASQGSEALELIASGRYEWALVDGTLKGGDLGDVITAIDAAAIPMAFVTSLKDGSDIAENWTGRAFVARPYGKKDLLPLLPRRA